MERSQFVFVNETHKSEIYSEIENRTVGRLLTTGSLTDAEKNYQAKVGDVVYFRRIRSETSNHVGIVIATDGRKITTVEGNIAGGVAPKIYEASGSKYDFDILGFGKINYIY